LCLQWSTIIFERLNADHEAELSVSFWGRAQMWLFILWVFRLAWGYGGHPVEEIKRFA